MEVLQLNCHKSNAVSANLVNKLFKTSQIALLQEPHTIEGKITGLSNITKHYFKDKRPRAAILSTPNINLWYCEEFSNRDMVTTLYTNQATKIYFCSVYMDITIIRIPKL